MSGDTSLAVLLRSWRRRALLTQEELARVSGLGVRTIRRLESDDLRRPRGDSVRLLAEALRLSDSEAALLIAAARGDLTAGRVPRQLPADLAGFVGRDRQLSELDALLTGGTQTIAVIAGPAGVGKTALAVHWAHRVADCFPDGQLYVDLRGFDPGDTPIEPAAAIRGFLAAFDVPAQRIPVDPDAQAAMYRSLLADKRLLVVLDNARNEAQVRPLLPGTCITIVTSRSPLTGLIAAEAASAVSLDLLSDLEARQLLSRRIGADRVAAEPEAVDEIVELCARLPLAIAVVAARAAGDVALDLAAIATELSAGLDALQTGDAVTDVRAVFSWSYRRLGAKQARLFRLLGVHPGPDVSVSAATSLGGRPARRVLDDLTRANLLTETATGRYVMHDLLRAYAAELALAEDSEDVRRGATERLIEHYVHTAHTANLSHAHQDRITIPPPRAGVVPEPVNDPEAALNWLVAERAVLLAVLQRAAALGYHAYTWQLAGILVDFFDRRGHWHDQAATQRLALQAAVQLADRLGQASAHRDLARAHARIGDYGIAREHLRQALDLFTALDDQSGQAHARLGLAWVHEREGDQAAALDQARGALTVFRSTGNSVGTARALNAVGWYHALLGDHRQALACCEQALALNEQIGDRRGLAACQDSLGYIHVGLRQFVDAIELYRSAVDAYRDLGDRTNEAEVLDHLADACHAAGDPAAARDAWRESVMILDQLGHPATADVQKKLEQSGRV